MASSWTRHARAFGGLLGGCRAQVGLGQRAARPREAAAVAACRSAVAAVMAPAEHAEATDASRTRVALDPDWRHGGGGGGFGCFS